MHWCWDHLVLVHWRNTVLKTYDINAVYKYFLDKINADEQFKNEYLNKKVEFVSIAEDSRAVVIKDVYDKMENYNFTYLPTIYANDTIALIQERIMKSGLQMAKILNDIFEERNKNKSILCNAPSLLLLVSALIFCLF